MGNEQTVILANGLFPSSKRCLDLLENATRIICCDGAADKLTGYGITPEVIIGDLDSLSRELKTKFASILIQDREQESNDLTKAVRYCQSRGYDSITVLGATGLREDHTLGNISLMLEYYPDVSVEILSDYGRFNLVESGATIPTYPGEQLSIFSLDNRVKVSANGLKYPLDKLPLSKWYSASLNEATGHTFTLEFSGDLPLILYQAWPDHEVTELK